MLVVDVEASGTDPVAHSIIAIGAVDTTNPRNRFYGSCRIWDGAHLMPDALAVVGKTPEEVQDPSLPSEGTLVASFFSWAESLADKTLAAHNVTFDHEFLLAAARRAHLPFPFASRSIDIHSVVYTHMCLNGYIPPFDTTHRHTALSFTKVLAYVGLPSEPSPHHALTGALLHAEVLSRIFHGTSCVAEYAHIPVPPHLKRVHTADNTCNT